MLYRLVKQKNYSDAKAIVYSGAKELLNAGQSGSGLDLAMLLLELYQLSTTPVCDDTVGKRYTILHFHIILHFYTGPLVELFRAFPVKSGDNQRYDYIKAVIK